MNTKGITEGINQVINRALKDDIFAGELRRDALKASEGGYQTEEWDTLMKYFVADASGLITLQTNAGEGSELWGPTTTTTVTTTTTGACTTTTTTTTTTTNISED